ncbi:MAG: VOC family protein [Microthrixaceae bacterium]|nr:VOC family protein [Microthrixaceae bacterium]MCO5322963.1 VOC family protein [Microthrixaceae bacterium]
MLNEEPTFTSSVYYRDVKAALEWLERAFGFELTMAIEGPPDAPEMGHWEMSCAGEGRVMIGAEWESLVRSPAAIEGANTQRVHVMLSGTAADLDAHCDNARANGATISMEPADQFYGDRTYRALDPEGHSWTFSARVRDVSRAEAEQAIGQPIESTTWS